MSKLDNLGRIWSVKIKAAEKVYEDWSLRYKVRDIVNFYEGKQWEHLNIPAGYEPYVLNLIQSSLEIKLPAMLFDNPVFNVSPKVMFESENIEIAEVRAQLKEDAVNTIVQADGMDFDETIELVFLSAFLSFGVVEVNYDADWIKNSRAGKPVLKSDQSPQVNPEGKTIFEPDFVPQSERIFVKYIDSSRFRVSAINSQKTSACEWVGYYEYIRLEDLLANKSYRKPKNLHVFQTDEFSDSYSELYSDTSESELYQKGDVVKVWFLWDLRGKKHLVFSEANDHIFKISDYNTLPIHDIRLACKTRGWYPIPPVYNWLSPQIEYNEAREMARAHRRRSIRKYTTVKGSFDPEELEKLEMGGDGTIAESKIKDPIDIVPNPPAGQDVNNSLVISKADFNIISGTSAEQRGQDSGGTATEAAITDRYSQVRDSKTRKKGARFLNRIARAIIKIITTQFTLPVLVETFAHDDSTIMDEIQSLESSWKEVSPDELEGEDYKIEVQVESLSPIANQEQKNAFLEFMAVINNYPQIAMSPGLIRKTADVIGFKDHKILKELQQMALLALMKQQEQGMGNALAQRQTEKATPNAQAQIESQLGTQVGLTQ